MKKAVTHIIRLALSAVIIAALVLFARKVNWHSTWHSIEQADRTILFAAAVVNLLSLALKAVRWWIFLRPVGAPSFWHGAQGNVRRRRSEQHSRRQRRRSGTRRVRRARRARAEREGSRHARARAHVRADRLRRDARALRVVPRVAASAGTHAAGGVGGARGRHHFHDLARAPARDDGGARDRAGDALARSTLEISSGTSATRLAASRPARASPSRYYCRSGSGRCRYGRTVSPRARRISIFRSSGP